MIQTNTILKALLKARPGLQFEVGECLYWYIQFWISGLDLLDIINVAKTFFSRRDFSKFTNKPYMYFHLFYQNVTYHNCRFLSCTCIHNLTLFSVGIKRRSFNRRHKITYFVVFQCPWIPLEINCWTRLCLRYVNTNQARIQRGGPGVRTPPPEICQRWGLVWSFDCRRGGPTVVFTSLLSIFSGSLRSPVLYKHITCIVFPEIIEKNVA